MVSGGIGAMYKKPSGAFRSIILHFAAGVVFSVVAVEILPDVVKEHEPVYVIIGFSLGLFTMLMIERFTKPKEVESAEMENDNLLPIGLLVAISVDVFIDGLLLGISFSAGSKEGMLLAFALALELLSLGMATAIELRDKGLSKFKTTGFIAGIGVIFFISAVLGAKFLNHLPPQYMTLILSFGLSALIFLVTEELLQEAHEEKESIWQTVIFFAGFLLFVILGMMV
ncbi:MAG: transporter [Cloacibacterium sp.]|nr:transporter [Cloacibacterium sp.]